MKIALSESGISIKSKILRPFNKKIFLKGILYLKII